MASANLAADLSSALAGAVERAGSGVVRVEGRRRGPASGTVWEDGLIVTAHHSLEWDEDVSIGLPTGEAGKAQVVGRDPTTDIALLRTPAVGLSSPDWRATEDLKVGHLVLALTRPGRTARGRLGIVHALGDAWRTGAGGRIDRYLETDVGPVPAFSGSLLVDAAGRGIGMNTAAPVRGASVTIPYATLKRVVGALLAHGRVRRGFLGISTVAVPVPRPDPASAPSTGLLVTSVQADSAAARGGLLLGDVLLAVEDQPLSTPADLMPFLEEERIGREAAFKVLRAGETRDVRLAIGARETGGSEGR
jgi:S1-C subfamily serine protease